jgi:hypothetical protein
LEYFIKICFISLLTKSFPIGVGQIIQKYSTRRMRPRREIESLAMQLDCFVDIL